MALLAPAPAFSFSWPLRRPGRLVGGLNRFNRTIRQNRCGFDILIGS